MNTEKQKNLSVIGVVGMGVVAAEEGDLSVVEVPQEGMRQWVALHVLHVLMQHKLDLNNHEQL